MADITLDYQPREQFIPFHQRNQRWACLVCHRRAGKTVACIFELIIRALYTPKKNARYAYIGPFRKQVKDIAWQYLKDGIRGIAVEIRESDLRVILPNGAWITLYGADNPDALRGLYFDGIIIDEFADCRPALWSEVVLPALADRRGWAVLIGTIKGKNHLWQRLQHAQQSNDWFDMLLKASESGLLPAEELAEIKRSTDEASYLQEMECDPTAAVKGTYYSDKIHQMESDGRIKEQDLYDPTLPVFAAMDLGRKDSTAIWYWQETENGRIAIFDYDELDGHVAETAIELLKNKGYDLECVWLPHDAAAKTFQTKRSSLEQFRQAGLNVSKVPQLSKQQGIDAARMMLDLCDIDYAKCEQGVEALRAYRREWNDTLKVFREVPLHDWACLPAGTLINTPTGPKAVEDFKPMDGVITKGKISCVVRAGAVQLSQVVEIKFTDGTSLRCTPEHKIFTRFGLVMAKDLCYGDAVLTEHGLDNKWLVSRKGIRGAFTESFKVSSTVGGENEKYIVASAEAGSLFYIASFGGFITETYQKTMRWFRKTMTGMTLLLRTGSAARTPIMAEYGKQSMNAENLMAENFTDTPNNLTFTIPTMTDEKYRSTAQSMKNTKVLYRKVLKFIIKILTPIITIVRIWKPCCQKTIESCTVLDEEIVYDIEVEGDHAYTLTESGVVTSNSDGADAFRYLALVAQQKRGKLPQKRSPEEIEPKPPEYRLDELYEQYEKDNKRLSIVRRRI